MANRRALPALDELFRILNRLRDDKLTETDREWIYSLLCDVSVGEDVRERFFEPVRNRPKADDADLKRMVACIYHGHVEADKEEHGRLPRGRAKVLRGELAELTGLSDGQIRDAVQTYRENALTMIAVNRPLSPRREAYFMAMILDVGRLEALGADRAEVDELCKTYREKIEAAEK